ncbi:secreted frizzled-related protein 1-like isoform X1 [Chiloscyllium punctatum]|uniref:secreted frizzled-related protein 1-like isoform X1 n=1 Tax=Chiloscyllium punctatum TaxID=137246 RepID=UPI003B6425E1
MGQRGISSKTYWKFYTVFLPLSMGLFAWCVAMEVEESSWQADSRFYIKPPHCVDIPFALRLCNNVGYHKMSLPNLLDHETMEEVQQQASSWVPLLNKNCHPNTQLFLCSLYAPICLDRPIYPCRSLCTAVRDACTPVMEFFGFPWPDMLKCDKFPLDNDLCIVFPNPNATLSTSPQAASEVCPPCDNQMNTDIILDHLCASEFALKMKIKEVKKENGDRKIIPQKKKKPLKLGPLKKKDLKKLTLYIKNGADCPCHQLDNLNSNFLIMGRKVNKQNLLTVIHRWDKKSKEVKKAVKKMKTHVCPTFQGVFK